MISFVLATLLTGFVAGISIDKCFVQLPARLRLGVQQFAAFSRANDLGNGLVLYPALGIGAALTTIIAAFITYSSGVTGVSALPAYGAALLAVMHSVVTTRAAPYMLMLRHPVTDDAKLAAVFDRFAAWHAARTILQVLNFLALIWALTAYDNHG
jgi:hypothetical protein